MKVKISYQTLILPPPYAFGYTLELNISKEKIEINYEMEYLNRETISEEEIYNEGFSTEDDFVWSGELDSVWSDHMLKCLSDISLQENSDDENIWMHFRIEDEVEKSGLVTDVETWDFNIQELIQAIYEKAGREQSLKIVLIHVTEGETKSFDINGSFEHRKSQINNRPIRWEDMQETVEMIFSTEFVDQPIKQPKKPGIYADPDGEGDYFELIMNKKTSNRLLSKLDSLLDQ